MQKQQFAETQITTSIKKHEGARQELDVYRVYVINKTTLYNCIKSEFSE
jgi:hypothetical protein